MGYLKILLIRLYLAVLGLFNALSVLGADQVPPQHYLWPWWPEMHWPAFGWVFPLACIVMMVAMLLFMTRRGGMGCMGRGRPTSTTALEILNERYARGEVDKKEYAEKKASINSG